MDLCSQIPTIHEDEEISYHTQGLASIQRTACQTDKL